MAAQIAAELTGSGELCKTLPSNQLLAGVQGTPLIGTWTIAEQSLLAPLMSAWSVNSVTPIQFNLPTTVQGVEVLLFVGAEPKPQSVPATYSLTTY